jgi:hypothetical protein
VGNPVTLGGPHMHNLLKLSRLSLFRRQVHCIMAHFSPLQILYMVQRKSSRDAQLSIILFLTMRFGRLGLNQTV